MSTTGAISKEGNREESCTNNRGNGRPGSCF